MPMLKRRRDKLYTKGFEAGTREHILEFVTTAMLFFGVITGLAWLKYNGWTQGEAILSGWLILSLVVHMGARWYHRRERKYLRKAHTK